MQKLITILMTALVAGALAAAPAGGSPTRTTPAEPERVAYVLNTNTMKFHYPSCSSVAQMAEHNKESVTCSREELIERGYSPCGCFFVSRRITPSGDRP